MAHPTLGNRPVPASPYPRESQSFASHANTRRVIRTTSARFSPSFLAPESFFFLTRFARPPSLPPPPCLVREFSWLAELTAFGKIASAMHRTGAIREACSHKEIPSASSPFAVSISLAPPPRRSLLRIASTTSLNIAHTRIQLRLHSWVRQCSFGVSFGERWRRGPVDAATKSLPLLEPVSRAHVMW